MSCRHYYPAADKTEAGLEPVRLDTENDIDADGPYETSGRGVSSRAQENRLPLQSFCQGNPGGVSSLQFMEGIDAWGQRLGNRALLRLVTGLRSGEQLPDTRQVASGGLRGPGRPLTHLDTLQRAFGHHDIRGMREHTDAAACSALNALGAEGYTSGGRMALPGTPGLYVQAHEAAHGVQQAALGNRMQLPDGTGEAGDRYERQADEVAQAVVKGQSAEPILDGIARRSTRVAPAAAFAGAPVQMKWPDRNLEDLSMEEFEAAIQEMNEQELEEAFEELTLLIEIAELGAEEVRSKPQAGAEKGKKEKRAKYKPSEQEIAAMRAAKKAQAGKKQPATGKKQKQEQKEPVAKAKPKKKGNLTLEDIEGLDNMFLARAINHLIMGELHQLDPMLGDEGCQMRTPFVLDMYRLVQQKIPANAIELVREYRAGAENEQVGVFKTLRGLEKNRRNKDAGYAGEVAEFIRSNPLRESSSAKSGEYESMFTSLTAAIRDEDPEYLEYLCHTCSEGAVYSQEAFDPFGISMLADRRSIFTETILSRRKVIASRYSKKYMARTAARLVEMGGGSVSSKEKEIGYDKKGKMEKEPHFLTARTNREEISAMLLHSIQMHSGAASVKGGRLEMGPCWDALRLAMTYALKQGYPLLVNLRRLIVSGTGEERRYSTNLARTLFYEPGAGGYKYQPNPGPSQLSQGALLILGYSMLKEGDTEIPGATVPIAPWVFNPDPEAFLAGFTQCDIANVISLGGAGTHPPLNTFAPGSNAYGLPGGPPRDYRLAQDDPGGVRYSEAVHDRVLADLGQPAMTESGRQFLIPKSETEVEEEYEEYARNQATSGATGSEAEAYIRTLFRFTDKAKHLVFPDQCPINIAGSGAKFNIKEEYQLLKQLSVAAGLSNVVYSKEDIKEGIARRVADRTVPFSIVHILASTFTHENELSRIYAIPKTRGIIERKEDLRRVN